MTTEQEQFEFLKKLMTTCYTDDNDRGKGLNIKNEELKFTIGNKNVNPQRMYIEK